MKEHSLKWRLIIVRSQKRMKNICVQTNPMICVQTMVERTPSTPWIWSNSPQVLHY